LDLSDRRKILTTKSENLFFSALQCSAWNEDPKSFLFMKNIYEKMITQKSIEEIFSEPNKYYLPYIEKVIEYGTIETAREVSKYLQKFSMVQTVKKNVDENVIKEKLDYFVGFLVKILYKNEENNLKKILESYQMIIKM
jgi:hypothetical protein